MQELVTIRFGDDIAINYLNNKQAAIYLQVPDFAGFFGEFFGE
jgi:hypothetical protein